MVNNGAVSESFWFQTPGLWCRIFHPAPMWPVSGYYRCPTCLREYRVPWELNGNRRVQPDTTEKATAPGPAILGEGIRTARQPS